MENADTVEILKESKVIAVVGLSPKQHRSSYGVAQQLQSAGYKIIPVYPREETILGEKVYRNLLEIPGRIDVVCIFRRSEEVLPVVEEAVKVKPKTVWMQQGIINEAAAKLAAENGIKVVMDRCMSLEYSLNRNEFKG